jgi:hypothetical protein
MRSTTSENLAAYCSIRDRRLQEIGACSGARHEAFPRASLGLLRMPPGRFEHAVTIERLKKASVVAFTLRLVSMSVRCGPIT